ncbi:MAG: hypothetical protein IJS14_15355 [Lentisphaeria bacterium]|nr:hypothetical protein [Lentisphaeria bacterium]
MEKLPVKLLSELLTPDEIITAENVRNTHEVGFCPVGTSLWDESYVALKCHCGAETYGEFRYTPRAYFAVKVWKTARDNLLRRPEFARALDIEWYPVAASFRSVRFVNGDPEKFIAAMSAEMKRIADSHSIEIRYGRFDAPAIPELPDYPRRYYIMPLDLMKQKRGYGMKDELKPLQGSPAGDFSWSDIADAFVVLKPIQLAFIAGDDMNYCRPLDEEFIDACGDFDLKKVKELVAKGANIHAVSKYGDTAMDNMICHYFWTFNEDSDEHVRSNNRARFIRLAEYLLSLGYNINLAGYAAATCLDSAPHGSDLEIVKFLLDNGADPNIGSFIGDGGEFLGRTVLAHVWDDYYTLDEGENYNDLELLLLRYGALPIPAGERISRGKLDAWIEGQKEKDRWNDSVCLGLSKFDAALINCAKNMSFYYMALIAQSGGDVNVRDTKGRNLLQVTLDENELTEKNQKYFKIDLAEMTLMLLCGLKLKLSKEEVEQAKATCQAKGCTEALDAITSVTSAGRN